MQPYLADYPQRLADCLFNQGVIHNALAGLDVSPVHHYGEAIRCFRTARQAFHPQTPDYARCLASEADALFRGRCLGIEESAHAKALHLYSKAGEIYHACGYYLKAIRSFHPEAQDAMEAGDWERAIKAYGAAIRSAEAVRGRALLTMDRKAWMDENSYLFSRAVWACIEADRNQEAPELTPRCWIRKTSGGTDLFGRLWWDRPAFTIRTEFFKPEKGRYLHPEQHRPITHREAARLQSFPDTFVFRGSKVEIARQIGNAVPPLLAAQVAAAVEPLLVHGQLEKSA